MCVDGAADMGKSSARTHGQGECLPAHSTPVPKVTLAVSCTLHVYVLDGTFFKGIPLSARAAGTVQTRYRGTGTRGI